MTTSSTREWAVHVELPTALTQMASVPRRVVVDLTEPPTCGRVLDALETRYPALRGTIRDRVSGRRRAFIRFFACTSDLSHDSLDAPLPSAVAEGREPLLIVGAMAGG